MQTHDQGVKKNAAKYSPKDGQGTSFVAARLAVDERVWQVEKILESGP